MTKKQSLATALQPFDRATQATPSPAPRTRKVKAVPVSSLPPSRIGKRAVIVYVDPGASKQLKQMALDSETSVQELVREALNDLFQKHRKPAIA
jgi:hypothetical protein